MIDMMTVTHIASRYAPYSMSGVAAGRTATFTFEGEGAEERAEEFVDDLRTYQTLQDRLLEIIGIAPFSVSRNGSEVTVCL